MAPVLTRTAYFRLWIAECRTALWFDGGLNIVQDPNAKRNEEISSSNKLGRNWGLCSLAGVEGAEPSSRDEGRALARLRRQS